MPTRPIRDGFDRVCALQHASASHSCLNCCSIFLGLSCVGSRAPLREIADGSGAVRQEEIEERILEHGVIDVRVHVGEPRHQVFPGAVDHERGDFLGGQIEAE